MESFSTLTEFAVAIAGYRKGNAASSQAICGPSRMEGPASSSSGNSSTQRVCSQPRDPVRSMLESYGYSPSRRCCSPECSPNPLPRPRIDEPINAGRSFNSVTDIHTVPFELHASYAPGKPDHAAAVCNHPVIHKPEP